MSASTGHGELAPAVGEGYSLTRKEVWILPTVITDRFGNIVTYTYDATNKWQLKTIVGTDAAGSPRTITLAYLTPGSTASNLVASITDGTRTWRYTYDRNDSGGKLQTVVLPDNSSWDVRGLEPLLAGISHIEGSTGSCDIPSSLVELVRSGSMTHPSGATGEFVLTPTRHGRVNVDRICQEYQNTGQGQVTYPRYFDTYALTRKTITGPGIGSLEWRTTYPQAAFSWASWDGQHGSKRVELVDPSGAVTYRHFGTIFRQTEGQLQLTETLGANTILLRSTQLGYVDPVLPRGISLQPRGDGEMAARVTEVNRRTIAQQGTNFVWQADEFNGFAQPTLVTRFSSPGSTRTERTEFENNTMRWVLGQVKSIAQVNTATSAVKDMVRHAYFPETANLKDVRKFGAFQESRTYHPDGTLASVTDGLNQSTRFDNYKRGIPQSVTFADNTRVSAVVNDLGGLTSATSASGDTTSFDHDAMGRYAGINYPTADSVAWNRTGIAFEKVADPEFDLAGGHWKQTITTGTGIEVNYFDAFGRPVYNERWDDADRNATQRLVRRTYDFTGRLVFESYPARTYGEAGNGVYYEFDALGRRTSTAFDSELGRLAESYSYSSTSFQKIHTNARGYASTYSFQTFDEPGEDVVKKILAPEGVSVDIARDIFGKPLSVTRRGGTKSLKRSFVYDSVERLFKIVEPEGGATVQAYDAAHNVSWRATGSSLTSTTACGTTSVPSATKTVFGYDARNRLRTTTYGDNSPGVTRTYTADGLLATVLSNGALWEYEYNKRQMGWLEKLTYGGSIYHIVRTYDANGSLAQLDYPFDEVSLTYRPNALGEARKVGGYATGIEYHPSGAVKAFVYGNGIRRSLSQHIRGLPKQTIDMGVFDETYSYDANGNPSQISDNLQNLATRTIGYDALDRLRTVSAPNLWGNATYNYDALDNLISSTISGGANARTLTHTINSTTNRLDTISGGPAAFNFSYLYDAQGNITRRGNQTYTFDQANRMTSAGGLATYSYDGLGRRISTVGADQVNRIQIYTQEGKLLYSGPTGGVATKYIYLNNHVIAEVK